MTEHVHKFNGTLLRWRGRCACGVWSSWDRDAKTWGPPYQSERLMKGLETQLRRFQDPSVPIPTDWLPSFEAREPIIRQSKASETTPDVVSLMSRRKT